MAAILDGQKLTLTGDVGDFGFGDYFSHSDVVVALAQIEDDSELEVFINSGGGIASDGAAIHALLARRSGATNVIIDGIAASAASLIAMAGDKVFMSTGAVMMIHDPSGFTVGTSEDHSKSIEGLEALANSYARVYAAKSGKTPNEARAIMKAESWYSPADAVAAGFADDLYLGKAKSVAAFDYRVYANAPQRLVALASNKNWTLKQRTTHAASAAHSPRKDISMDDKERADKLAAELEAMKKTVADKDAELATKDATLASFTKEKEDRERADAIMALDESKGREAQAKALCESGVTVDNAKKVLATFPKDAGDEPPRRLNGEGLNVNAPSMSAKNTGSDFAVANMRKQLGIKESN